LTTEARIAKAKYTGEISKAIDPYFWRFFTADSITIRRLTNAVGWNFRETGEEFVHTTSTVLITPNKMISQYFYGTYFNYMHFTMSLNKANNEEVEPTRLKSLKYCYNYKPEENKSLLRSFRSFGISMIIVMVLLFVYLAILRPKNVSGNR
jgi:protein SCO1/2